ncbi:MAG: pilin [Patescibacteria group bacterium]|jgi:hypothetical protein
MKRIFALTFCFVMLVPAMAWAVESTSSTCECFCKTKDGAESLDNQNSSDECYDACKKKDGYSLLGCYKDDAAKPENNLLCWTEESCTSTVSEDALGAARVENEKEVTLEWGGQNSICPSGKGYCYNPPENIKLGVAIGSLTEVGNLSTYIDAVYGFLLPAVSLCAVVLLMVAGMQWITALGDPGKINKAKERIVKSVFALLLVFGSYAIAYLIDPRLTQMDALRIPMIQRVVYLDDTSSCEGIAANKGVTVEMAGNSNYCGDSGIVHIEENTTVIGLKEGDSCFYQHCSDARQACAQVSGNTEVTTGTTQEVRKWQCVACEDIYEDGPIGTTPSESTCSALSSSPEMEAKINLLDGQSYCSFYDGLIIGEVDSCVRIEYPANETFINCQALRADAQRAGSESCRAYDLVLGRVNVYDGPSEIDNWRGDGDDYPLMQEICEGDPCMLGENGGCKMMRYDAGAMAGICGGWSEYLPWCAITTSTDKLDCVDAGYYSKMTELLEVDWETYVVSGNSSILSSISTSVDALTSGPSITGVTASGAVGPVEYNPTW